AAVEPTQAKLRGNLVIRLLHVDRLIVEAKAAELTLIREGPSSDKWFLSAEEVERLAQANGIPAEPAPSLFERGGTWLGLVVAAAVAAVVSMCGWLFLRARRQPAAEQRT